MERRRLGQTGESLSMLGFGGVIVTNTPQKEADRYVATAVERGVNYFDVSPFYGNAQERLGPALTPYRDKSFLACKTRVRTAEGADRELAESLRLLQTDYFDLYQLHSLSDVEADVNRASAPGGALEAFQRAREAGKIRFIGFSAHTEDAAHAAMDAFDFDTILFPFNYFAWTHGGFGPSVFDRASEKGMGVLALKAAAQRRWSSEEWKGFFRPWPKCWYRPIDDPEQLALALRFTLSLPVTAAIPPGHWHLFEQCLDIVEGEPMIELSAEERDTLDAAFEDSRPIFERAAS